MIFKNGGQISNIIDFRKILYLNKIKSLKIKVIFKAILQIILEHFQNSDYKDSF